MTYLGRLVSGLRSLAVGLSITVRELFKRPVTLQYPHEKPTLSPAYRSAIKLIRFDETGSHDCVACLACERICPSFCISIDGGKVEGIKKKRASAFTMDFALCSLCGLCIDVCPTTTLEYSRLYDEAGYDRDWTMDLLSEFRDYEATFVAEQREREEREAAAKVAAAAAKKAAKAKAKAPAGGDGDAAAKKVAAKKAAAEKAAVRKAAAGKAAAEKAAADKAPGEKPAAAGGAAEAEKPAGEGQP